jgi:hypothetical protein
MFCAVTFNQDPTGKGNLSYTEKDTNAYNTHYWMAEITFLSTAIDHTTQKLIFGALCDEDLFPFPSQTSGTKLSELTYNIN